MKEQLNNLNKQAEREIKKANDLIELDKLEIRYLGRKGVLTKLLRAVSELPERERPETGRLANAVKKILKERLSERRKEFEAQKMNELMKEEWFDATLPGKRPPEGHLHLVTAAIGEIVEIFERIGFRRREYPEVEWDWYAFESLNMPKEHPARDEWETFFVSRGTETLRHPKYGKMVLTPHTSSGQVREMERGHLPIRMMNISKCYRRQSDVSHVPMFHQFEGLLIDKQVSITHLKGVLDYFAKAYFGPRRKIRLRPFHFQFTEPSFEVDVSCGVCGGKGTLPGGARCRLCKEGWLELGGAGMVHPNVLRFGGVDPKKYSGFAFGWGVERTFMMREGMKIDDIRILYKSDLRFLKQF